jgi:hypothetical protein
MARTQVSAEGEGHPLPADEYSSFSRFFIAGSLFGEAELNNNHLRLKEAVHYRGHKWR